MLQPLPTRGQIEALKLRRHEQFQQHAGNQSMFQIRFPRLPRLATKTILLTLGLLSILTLPLASADSTIVHNYGINCSLLSLSQSHSGSSSGLGGTLHGSTLGSCNSGGVEAVAFAGGDGSSSADSIVTMTDTFTIPNNGQSSTIVAISGDYYVTGFVSVNGLVGLCCWFQGSADIIVGLTLTRSDGSFLDHWALQDWNQQCTGLIVGSCGQYVTINSSYSFSASEPNLSAGTYELVLTFEAKGSYSAGGLSGGQSMACAFYNGDCNNTPLAINGGVPPQSPSSSCPSGIAIPCYYIQWKDTAYTLTDIGKPPPPPPCTNCSSGGGGGGGGRPREL